MEAPREVSSGSSGVHRSSCDSGCSSCNSDSCWRSKEAAVVVTCTHHGMNGKGTLDCCWFSAVLLRSGRLQASGPGSPFERGVKEASLSTEGPSLNRGGGSPPQPHPRLQCSLELAPPPRFWLEAASKAIYIRTCNIHNHCSSDSRSEY